VNRLQNDRWSALTAADGLPDSDVRQVLCGKDGTIWLATPRGLGRIREGRVSVISLANGLLSDSIFQILDDRNGSLWMGTSRGIFRVSRYQLEEFASGALRSIAATSFGVTDGLESGSVMGGAQPAGWRAADGRLWFPTIVGAAVVDPRRLIRNKVPPSVLIEGLIVDRKAIDRARWREDSITLPAGSREVEIRYTAPSFVSPDRVRFQYRLEGYNGDWEDLATRRVVYFTNLAPGAYRFHVRACNDDGVWNETGASLAFAVAPHFYQTGAFYMLAALLVGALTAGAFRLRISQLRRRERELAHQVEQALAEVKVLSGLLPICASCKRIRNKAGQWSQIEAYIRSHSQAEFSHGICPDCMIKLYPEFTDNLTTK
jgi:hypothetical protein